MARCSARWAVAAAAALACALLLSHLPAAAAANGCQDGNVLAKDLESCRKFCYDNAPVGILPLPFVYQGAAVLPCCDCQCGFTGHFLVENEDSCFTECEYQLEDLPAGTTDNPRTFPADDWLPSVDTAFNSTSVCCDCGFVVPTPGTPPIG
ncbi:hypothetical protein ABPG75_013992 [Micractinium tetrahymenae]